MRPLSLSRAWRQSGKKAELGLSEIIDPESWCFPYLSGRWHFLVTDLAKYLVLVCRYLDPDEAVLRLKANRNANKEDRDGRVLETMQVRHLVGGPTLCGASASTRVSLW